MTPQEKVEERAKELYECQVQRLRIGGMVRPWSGANINIREDWRRVARLTFKMERDAAYKFGDNDDHIHTAYAGLLPGEE